MMMGEVTGITLRLATLVVAGGLLGGCVAQAAHAVFSPMLTSASNSLQTPESVGITPATWRGKSCQDLAVSYGYMADIQRETAASGDAHMAKVHGWQLDAIQQVRNEQGCLSGNGTIAQVQPVAAAIAPTAPAETSGVRDLGLTLQRPAPELVKALGLADSQGAWVVAVASGSAAANAGIKPMDVIREVSGQLVDSPDDFVAITGKMRAGYQANLTVWRNRANQDIPLTLPARSSAPETAAVPAEQIAHCYVYLTSDAYEKHPDVLSAVFRAPAAMRSADEQVTRLKQYVGVVQGKQPGIWSDFDYKTSQCSPTTGVCWASASPAFGPRQAAWLKCFGSEALAKGKRAEEQSADPTATLIEMH